MRQTLFEIVGVFETATAPGAGPVDGPPGLLRALCVASRPLARRCLGHMADVHFLACATFGNLVRRVVLDLTRLGRTLGFRVALIALEQRVALQFAFYIGLQFHVGELQQLYGLLQLGGDHQPLALTKL